MAVKASATITLTQYRDTQSVTRYYKLQPAGSSAPLKPTTKPPSSDWTDSQPACDISKELYFCDLTIFSNGEGEYSKVSKSTSYEAAKEAYNKAQSAQDSADNAQAAIDKLEIGGRNLVTNSVNLSDFNIESSAYTTRTIEDDCCIINRLVNHDNSGIKYGIYKDIPVTAGEEYTVSCTVKEITGRMLLGLGYDAYVWAGLGQWNLSVGRFTCTVTAPSSATFIRIYIYGNDGVNGGSVTVSNIKLEKGNRATDWTPAPEDVEEKIGDIGDSVIRLESSIEQTAGAVVIEALSDYVRNEDVENEDGTVTEGFNSIIESLRAAITAADGRVTTEVANRTTANDGIQQQITEIRNRMDFDESGLIFKSFVDGVESPYRIRITNDEMIFYNGATEVQRFDAQGNAKIPSLVVDNSMRLGGFALTTDSSGNLNLDWIGGN